MNIEQRGIACNHSIVAAPGRPLPRHSRRAARSPPLDLHDKHVRRALGEHLAREGAAAVLAQDDRSLGDPRHRAGHELGRQLPRRRKGQSAVLGHDARTSATRRCFGTRAISRSSRRHGARISPTSCPRRRLRVSTAVTGMLAPLVIAYRTDLVEARRRAAGPTSGGRTCRGQIGLYTITNSAGGHAGAMGGRAFRQGPDRHRHGDPEVRRAPKPFPQIAYSAQLTPLLRQGQIAMAPIDIGEMCP